MNFGEALEALKSGTSVARQKWNTGPATWLRINHPGQIVKLTANEPHLSPAEDLPPYVEERPTLPSKEIWLISHEDVLAEDWYMIKVPK